MGRTYTQDEHARINAREYPGTRQLCVECDDPTERCEEDARYVGDYGPLCEACDHRLDPDVSDTTRADTSRKGG